MDSSNTKSGSCMINFTQIELLILALVNRSSRQIVWDVILLIEIMNLMKSSCNYIFTVAIIVFVNFSCFIISIHFNNTVNFPSEPEASKESNGSC